MYLEFNHILSLKLIKLYNQIYKLLFVKENLKTQVRYNRIVCTGSNIHQNPFVHLS